MMELFLGTWTYRSLLNDTDLSTASTPSNASRAATCAATVGPAPRRSPDP